MFYLTLFLTSLDQSNIIKWVVDQLICDDYYQKPFSVSFILNYGNKIDLL